MKPYGPLALALLLASCAPVTQIVQVPQIEVEGIRLISLSLPAAGRAAEAGLTLALKVTNPNPVPVRVANVAAELVIEGEKVGDIVLPNVDLPARGQRTQQASLQVPVTLGTVGTLIRVARGEEVSYRLDGTFTADLGALGRPTFGPFTLSQGVWKQPALRVF